MADVHAVLGQVVADGADPVAQARLGDPGVPIIAMGVIADLPVVNSSAPSPACRIAGRTAREAVSAPAISTSNCARADRGVVSSALVMPIAARSGARPEAWSKVGAGL